MASFTPLSSLAKRVVSVPKIARRYASSAVKVPLVMHGIDGRYATALYSAAAKKNSLDAVEGELKQVKKTVERDANLSAFLQNPSVDRDQKKLGVRGMLKQGKYCTLTHNMFDLLAENGRLGETTRIIDAYLALMAAHRGEIPVTIVSAKPLDAKIMDKLKTALSKSKFVGSNQKLVVNNRVDPKILGGLMVEFGNDQTIDVSAASRIAKLNRLLSDAI